MQPNQVAGAKKQQASKFPFSVARDSVWSVRHPRSPRPAGPLHFSSVQLLQFMRPSFIFNFYFFNVLT